MADLQKIADGTVADAEKALSGLNAQELRDLRDLEKNGKDRVTLIDAIDAELEGRDETETRDAAEVAAYNQGRHARKSGIGEAESPHGKGALRDAWVEGWKFQDKA